MANMKDLVLGITVLGGGVELAAFGGSKYNVSLVKYPGSIFILGGSWWGSLGALLFSHSDCLDLDKLAVE